MPGSQMTPCHFSRHAWPYSELPRLAARGYQQ